MRARGSLILARTMYHVPTLMYVLYIYTYIRVPAYIYVVLTLSGAGRALPCARRIYTHITHEPSGMRGKEEKKAGAERGSDV